MDKIELPKYIDHTILKPFATKADIVQLCNEAIEHNFAAVCVNPSMVEYAKAILKGSPVNVCTVVGFPLGANATSIKLEEAQLCIEHGAHEIDMVINIGEAKAGNWKYVENEITQLATLCHSMRSTLKVIFENCFLTDDEIILACKASVVAGADYVKTSTGFGTSGATLEDVTLMKETVNGKCKIKAAGGIRDKESAIAMIKAGADRIGTSAGVKIVE